MIKSSPKPGIKQIYFFRLSLKTDFLSSNTLVHLLLENYNPKMIT